MLIIADKRIPEQAIRKLSDYGDLFLFRTNGITYEAIAGHPDIFFCMVNSKLVVAPNLPDSFLRSLENKKIRFEKGELPVGAKYPESARYNVVCTDKYLFHNFRYTDSVITSQAGDLDLVHLSQGYARCNLIPLKNNRFITSDEGVHRVLINNRFESLLVNPRGILLPGFKHGFIGGASGVMGETLFFIGKLDHFPDGVKVKEFLSTHGHPYVELYDGPLFDGGSLLFIGDANRAQC